MKSKSVRGASYSAIAALVAFGIYHAFDSYRVLKADVEHTEWMLSNQQEQLTLMREQMIAEKVTPREFRPTQSAAESQIRLAALQQSALPSPIPLPLPLPLPGNSAVETFPAAGRTVRAPVRPTLRLPVAAPERHEAEEAEVALVDDTKQDLSKPMMNVKLLGDK